MAQHTVRSPPELQQACSIAEAGDVIVVYGGLYDKPSVIEKCAGRPDNPIVFKTADDEWISGGRSPDPYWGGTTPAQDAPQKPSVKDFAFLIIDECTHVVIDGLKIRECWPSILFVKDTRYLQIRNCVWRGQCAGLIQPADQERRRRGQPKCRAMCAEAE
jgi:hypothetical protein